MKSFVLMVVLSVGVSPCFAAMFKCKQPDGSYIFSDKGCDGSEFIERKEMPKQQLEDEIGAGKQASENVRGGCSEEDKRVANEHFAKAEEILQQRSRHDELTSRYMELSRRYKHEMMVGQTLLSACSGVAMPQEQKNQRLRMNCQTIGNSTFCN